MRARAAARVAWSLWAFGAALGALGLLLWALSDSRYIPNHNVPVPAGAAALAAAAVADDFDFEVRLFIVFSIVALAGAFIAARRPHNPIGWLLIAPGVAIGVRLLADGCAAYFAPAQLAEPLPLAAATIVWAGGWLSLGTVGPIGPVVLLFPNGRLPSRRWRPVLALQVTGVIVAAVARALAPGPLFGWPLMPNPFALAGTGNTMVLLLRLGAAGVGAGICLAAISLGVRLRRATGDERQQVKWVLYGAALLVAGFPGATVITLAPAALPPAGVTTFQTLFLLALLSFLGTLAVAVLRYRLYEIDLVINKTLVYGALAVVITSVYVAVVAGIGAVVGSRGEPNLVLSLLATALVAVAFQPLRERLQRLANRLVYGYRASPYEVLAGFSRRLSGALSVDEVLPRLAEAAARGVGAARARARVSVPGGHDQAACWPADGADEPFERVVPVLHQGQPVGEIALAPRQDQPLTGAEDALLRDLAAQVGPALSNVRLALELRTQAAELRASRQRLVAAQDAERRRLERDLHDGAQQDLVAVAVNARLAREVLRTEPAEAEALLDEVAAQAAAALATLRDVARGIFPSALVDQGLTAAVEAHLAKSRWPAAFETDGSLAGARYAPEVEAAVYFCVREAVQNAAKHAPGAAATVRLAAADGGLSFTVADRGSGFDPAGPHVGTGLHGMADRLAAVGGTLAVRSHVGAGTTVSGRVPVPATPAGPDGRQDGWPVAAAQAAVSAAGPNSPFAK